VAGRGVGGGGVGGGGGGRGGFGRRGGGPQSIAEAKEGAVSRSSSKYKRAGKIGSGQHVFHPQERRNGVKYPKV